METIAKIRLRYHTKGQSIKQIARELGLSRNTVRKVLREGKTTNAYERAVQPSPKLGDYQDQLESWLEADSKLPKNQRCSAKRQYERLQAEGYTGAYEGAREQIAALTNVIDAPRALALWDEACATQWDKTPVWVHGDFAIGNILVDGGKLSAVIDFGGTALGDPACDLVIAWTYLSGKAREIFMVEIDRDQDTWLRARAWALWKATFELCQIADKNSPEVGLQKRIIEDVMNE